MFDLLKSKEIDRFARSMVEQFARAVPLEKVGKHETVARAAHIVLGHAQGFKRQHSLGFFGKARLANKLMWGLIERGYPKSVGDELANQLAIHLADKDEKKR